MNRLLVSLLIAITPVTAKAEPWGVLDCRIVTDYFENARQVNPDLWSDRLMLRHALAGADREALERLSPRLSEHPFSPRYPSELRIDEELLLDLLRDRCDWP